MTLPNCAKSNKNLSLTKKKFPIFCTYLLWRFIWLNVNHVHLIFAKAESHENEESFRAEKSGLVRAEKGKFSKGRTQKLPALAMRLRRDLNGVRVTFFHFGHLSVQLVSLDNIFFCWTLYENSRKSHNSLLTKSWVLKAHNSTKST